MSAKQEAVMNAVIGDMNDVGTFVTDEDITQKAILDNQSYVIFSPLESIPTDARFMGFKEVPKGQLFLIKTHKYKERSVSEEVMKGETDPYLEDIANPAREITESLYRTYGEVGLTVSRALLGAPPPLKDWCNHVLLDDAPPLLYQLIAYLRGAVVTRIQQAVLPPQLVSNFLGRFNFDERALLEAVRKELVAAALFSENYARTYVGKYKGELLKSGNPKDKGISYVHEKLRYYCEQLGVAAPDDIAESADRMRQAALSAQAVVAQGDGLQRSQCPECGELIPLINGALPKKCRYCGSGIAAALTAEEEQVAVEAVESLISGHGNLHDVMDSDEDDDESPVSLEASVSPAELLPSGTISEKAEGVAITPPTKAAKTAAKTVAKNQPKAK